MSQRHHTKLESTMSAPAAKVSAHKLKRTKRGSRNKKKNAKKIDLSEITEHQEDVRLQERTGGLVASKSDDQLFFIETGQADADGTSSRPLTRKERARAKVLHNDEALEANPHIKAVVSRPSTGSRALYRGAVSETHKPAVTYRPPSKRRRTGEQVKEDMSVLEVDGSMTVAPPMMAKDQGPATLWERPKAALTVVDLDPWLRPVRVSQQAIKPPALHTKKEATAVPAVETPESGVSYNPAYMAHQKVLTKALTTELARVKKHAKTEKKLPTKRSNREIGEAMFEELAGGLLPGHPELEEDPDDELLALDDPDVVAVAAEVASGAIQKRAVVPENRKTKAQRHKQERHKERQKVNAAKKLARSRESKVYQLRNLKKQLAVQDTEFDRRQTVKGEREVQALQLPRKLSRKDFRDSAPVYKLTDELTGSLRTSKPESNLVSDRFASLQKRNEIEVRIPIKIKRRYKLKEYTKRSYKNYELQESLRKEAKLGK